MPQLQKVFAEISWVPTTLRKRTSILDTINHCSNFRRTSRITREVSARLNRQCRDNFMGSTLVPLTTLQKRSERKVITVGIPRQAQQICITDPVPDLRTSSPRAKFLHTLAIVTLQHHRHRNPHHITSCLPPSNKRTLKHTNSSSHHTSDEIFCSRARTMARNLRARFPRTIFERSACRSSPAATLNCDKQSARNAHRNKLLYPRKSCLVVI